MIKFRCSHCKKKFGVPDDYAGRRIRCNTCDHHTIVPKSALDADRVAATDQREVDGSFSIDPVIDRPEQTAPMELVFKLRPDLPDDELITTETLLNTPKSPDVEIQLQSFHSYPAPEDTADEPVPPEPVARQSLTETLKRCHPAADDDRTESMLNIMGWVSCIGPVLFIFMFFYAMIAIAAGDSPRSSAAHYVPPADPNVAAASEPNAVTTPNPATPLSMQQVVMYTSLAFGVVISPLALLLSLFLVFRYCYDMPKTLYFAIVVYGLVFFNIFRG
jgi:DNA-directed RNA polymerase subunit RPC12/RpoP